MAQAGNLNLVLPVTPHPVCNSHMAPDSQGVRAISLAQCDPHTKKGSKATILMSTRRSTHFSDNIVTGFNTQRRGYVEPMEGVILLRDMTSNSH